MTTEVKPGTWRSGRGPRAAALIAGLLALWLAACQSATPTSPPDGPFVPAPREQATVPPPEWRQAGAVITQESAPGLAYLGRLDSATSLSSTVFAHSFSPDGSRLAALNNEQLLVWDLLTGRQVFGADRRGALSVYYGADKDSIYTITQEGDIQLYLAERGSISDTLGGHDLFNSMTAYSPDAGWLALGGKEGTIKVWDPAERRALATLTAGASSVLSLSFSSDGARLASTTLEGLVTVWDWQARQPLMQMNLVSDGVRLSPDGALLAVSERSRVTIWDAATGDQRAILTTGGPASDVFTFSPDGQLLLTSSGATGAVQIWSLADGRLLNTLVAPFPDRAALAFDPSGDLAVTTLLGGPVTLWPVDTFTAELRRAELNTPDRDFADVAFSPDGFLLLLFQGSGPVQVWGLPRAAG